MAAPFTFRDFAFRISPPWLRRFVGRRFVGGAIGLTYDLLSEGAAQALKAPWLLSNSSPDDALPSIGTERSMPRYPADTNSTYRARLHKAWDTWQHAGNGVAIVEQLEAAGYTNTLVIPASNNDERPERPSWRFEEPHAKDETLNLLLFNIGVSAFSEILRLDGQDWADLGYRVNWAITLRGTTSNDGRTFTIRALNGPILELFDTSESTNPIVSEGPVLAQLLACWWSRFVVVIEQPHPWIPWVCGNGFLVASGDDAHTVGSTATVGEVRTTKAIARKWKSGHSINPYLLIVLSGEYVGDPDLICGGGAVVGGETIKWMHQV